MRKLNCLVHVIALGDPFRPPAEGGREPDAPVWYFSSPEEFESALDVLVATNLEFTIDTLNSLPEGAAASSAEGFSQYLNHKEAQ